MQTIHEPAGTESSRPTRPGFQRRFLWVAICLVVVVYCGLLIAQTIARVRFPWDMYWWPESPFLVGMLKLFNHQPVYTSPNDCNSFVYSPGLQYIAYAVLKPFGLALDIRFCRLVSLALGMGAAFCASMATMRLIRSAGSPVSTVLLLPLSLAFFWLVVSLNLLSDLCHPDNLHALHATALFAMCLAAMETRRSGWAVIAMIWAGLGVFTKQTEAVSLLGPVLVFAWFKPWGLRRQVLLAGIGVVVLGISLWLMLMPPDARFFTLDVLRCQQIKFLKIFDLLRESFDLRDRGLSLVLTVIAARWCWKWGGASRRYLVCWAITGVFTALPNVIAYIKVFGAVNNLSIIEVWKMMLVWPACMIYMGKARPTLLPAKPGGLRGLIESTAAIWLLLAYLAFGLLPRKPVPSEKHYAYCRAVDAAVRAGVLSGKKVLVSHGATFLIHAGVTSVPLDQANTVLELNAGKKSEPLMAMKKRLDARQYDRIYLPFNLYSSAELMEVFHRRYRLVSTIAGPKMEGKRDIIGQEHMMDGCEIWESRE